MALPLSQRCQEKAMTQQVFINLPVSDVAKATAFYEALGFTKDPNFSDENASSMAWSENIVIMLLDRNYYKKFIRNKTVADTVATSGVLIALSLDSKEAVQKFADTAKVNGGDYFKGDIQVPEDMMMGYEVLDLDGNQLEPVWMNPDFVPNTPTNTL